MYKGWSRRSRPKSTASQRLPASLAQKLYNAPCARSARDSATSPMARGRNDYGAVGSAQDDCFLFQDNFRGGQERLATTKGVAPQGAITASSVGLTVAPAARAEESVVTMEVIVSPCRSGRRLNAI